MRLPTVTVLLSLLMLYPLCSCNSFVTDKKQTHPKNEPEHKLDDIEFQKLRKRQDSLLEMRQKKTKPKGLDTLKPKQA